jgi:hypothetical protein
MARLPLGLAFFALLSACGNSNSAAPPTPTDSAIDTAADTATKCAKVGGETYDGASDAGLPLVGVKVCVYQHPEIPCLISSDKNDAGTGGGLFLFDCLPPNVNLALTFEKDGYVKILSPVAPAPAGETTLHGVTLPTVAKATLAATAMKTTYPTPAGKNIVIGTLFDGSGGTVTGGVVSLSTSATTWYTDGTTGLPDGTLKATSKNGQYLFVDTAPGEVDVTATAAGKPCVPRFGWPSAKAGTMTIPVADGFVTDCFFACTP